MKCKNKSGAAIKEGQLVQLDKMSKLRKFFIKLGLAAPLVKEVNPVHFDYDDILGFVKEDCKKGSIATVVQCGIVNDIDTDEFNVGEELYISKVGGLTNNPNE